MQVVIEAGTEPSVYLSAEPHLNLVLFRVSWLALSVGHFAPNNGGPTRSVDDRTIGPSGVRSTWSASWNGEAV